MKTLRYLLEKEFKQIKRDRFLPRIIFLVPLMQLLILPFAANFEMRNINLGVIDHDHSVVSVQLVEKILSSGYFRLTDVSSSYDQAITSIESNESDLLLEIPAKFEQELGREGKADVLIAANAVNGTKGGMGSSYLTQIIQDFNRDKGFTSAAVSSGVRATALFNPHLNYKNYMVPGILVFLLTIIGGFLSALNIVSEKEKGTIEQIVLAVEADSFLGNRFYPVDDRGHCGMDYLRFAAGRQYGDYLFVCGSLSDCFYRFGVGNIFYIVQPATGDVHGFLLLDYICFVERTFYPDQQYAAMGTDYNII